MHFELLVEDQSGKKALDILVPKILGAGHTHTLNIHAYRGIGRIPKDLRGAADPVKRMLLDRLPGLLRGYGNTFAGWPSDFPAAVVVVCDLDDRCLKAFRDELLAVLGECNPAPLTCFCIAIKESEAWLLGDPNAIRTAYPQVKGSAWNKAGDTWETLADVVTPGEAAQLARKGYPAIGEAKSRWAEEIAPHMDVDNNQSASFVYFRDKLRALAAGTQVPTSGSRGPTSGSQVPTSGSRGPTSGC
ncbi:MAG: DUF4276 family protein [Magnetococcus sp. YQC-3]